MKSFVLLISGFLLAITYSFSQTHIPGGNVSGTWTKSNNPYIIDGHITIQSPDLLIIEPGVTLSFSSVDYGLTIEGRILAIGTYHDSIKFTSSTIYWRRLKFLNTTSNGQDSSKLVYCIIEKGDTYDDIVSSAGGGIYCNNSSDLFINHCLIKNNYTSLPDCSGGGIFLRDSNPLIINSKITDNSTHSSPGSYGGGITCVNSNPTLKNLLIVNNEVSGEDTFGGGLALIGSNPVIENITVYGNVLDGSSVEHGGGIFYVYLAGNISIINSIIRNNTSDEIYVEDGIVNVSYSNIGGGFSGTGNIDEYPLFYDLFANDYRLTWDNWPTVDATKSPCIDGGDPASPLNPDGTQADMGAYYWHHGTHVCGEVASGLTWTLAGSPYVLDCFTFVHHSLELIIEPGVEVLFPQHYTFNVYGRLTADGDVSNPISFSSINPDAGWPGIRFFNTITNGQSESLLNYCIISGGHATGSDAEDNYGGGIYCENSSDIWIFNCDVEDNYAAEKGGGIYCLDSDILLSNNLIQDNTSGNEGGGVYCENSDIVASNIYVRDNNAENGGGLYIESSDPVIEQSSITGNNAPSGGGVIFDNCNGNFSFLTVVKNTASWGGGMACITSGNPTFDNITISENTATILGGGIYCLNSNPVLTNSIVWNNYSPQEIYLGSGGDVSATYSDIYQHGKEIWPGTGNINADPQFIDPVGWDFHFSWIGYPDPETKSPCIDTGDPSSTSDPDGTRADMGALPYEQTYTPITGGNISGTLTCAGSPYQVFGDLTIPVGDELIIEPCVYIIFQGDYRLTVDGRLLAEATEENNITFYPADRTVGWQGIRFYDSNANGQDSSKLVHCRIRHGNADGYYGHDNFGGGLFLFNSSDVVIDHCLFIENRAEASGGALFLTAGSSPDVRNSTFLRNTALNGGAIWCYDNINSNFLNCVFSNNVAEYGGAVGIASCAPAFSGCSMRKNRATKFGGAIYHTGGQEPTFDNVNRCNIYDNYAEYAGLDFYTAADVYVPPVLDIYLDTASVALMNEHFAFPIQYFNIVADNAWFIQEDSDLYVSTTGSDLNSGTSPSYPLKTIKMALIKVIANSVNPKTIHIANGIYSPSLTGDFFPINHRSFVMLSGESSAHTRLEGDTLYRILVSYADVNDSITNLTFQYGYKDGEGGAVVIENNSNPVFYDVSMLNNYSTYNGGAVWCYDDCNPVFSAVYFANNYSDNSGGALYFQENDTILMYNIMINTNKSRNGGGGIHASYNNYCRIIDGSISFNELINGGGGGAIFRNGPVSLEDLWFNGNNTIGSGGGMFADYNVDMEINNCTFSYNVASVHGGGLYFYNGVDINMEDVIFGVNSSIEGGAIWGYYGSSLNINNGLFYGNNTLYDPYISGDGGAMRLADVETDLNNVSITANVSDGDGGGLYCWASSGSIDYSIQNSIIYGNSPDQIYVDYVASVDVNYSDIENGWPSGTGNINADPDFTPMYLLNASSPCINAGNPDTTGMNLSMFDLAGNPRISNDTVDMGAYEFFQGIELDLKAFLEGPYNGSTMNTDLANSTNFPKYQPYNTPPWNYSGAEEVSAIPFDNIVDWILIEVRDTTDVSLANPESIVGRQAVFLLDDGSLVDINGTNIKFGNPVEHQCYITIYHRNHLGIISAYPLTESGGVYTFDFTTPAGQAYGTDAQRDLGGFGGK